MPGADVEGAQQLDVLDVAMGVDGQRLDQGRGQRGESTQDGPLAAPGRTSAGERQADDGHEGGQHHGGRRGGTGTAHARTSGTVSDADADADSGTDSDVSGTSGTHSTVASGTGPSGASLYVGDASPSSRTAERSLVRRTR